MFGFKGTPGAEDFVEFLESNRMLIVLWKVLAKSDLFVGGIWSEKKDVKTILENSLFMTEFIQIVIS